MVGVWERNSGAARIVLSASGAAEFTDVPKELPFGEGPNGMSRHTGPWTDLISAAGTWNPPSSKGGGLPTMTGGLNKMGYEIFIEGDSRKTWRIFLAYGDDLEYKFSFRHVAAATAP